MIIMCFYHTLTHDEARSRWIPKRSRVGGAGHGFHLQGRVMLGQRFRGVFETYGKAGFVLWPEFQALIPGILENSPLKPLDPSWAKK